jgi:hypothetical protein
MGRPSRARHDRGSGGPVHSVASGRTRVAKQLPIRWQSQFARAAAAAAESESRPNELVASSTGLPRKAAAGIDGRTGGLAVAGVAGLGDDQPVGARRDLEGERIDAAIPREISPPS